MSKCVCTGLYVCASVVCPRLSFKNTTYNLTRGIKEYIRKETQCKRQHVMAYVTPVRWGQPGMYLSVCCSTHECPPGGSNPSDWESSSRLSGSKLTSWCILLVKWFFWSPFLPKKCIIYSINLYLDNRYSMCGNNSVWIKYSSNDLMNGSI